jgi:catechol 2,3-dioxygenase-like lactoylglutathione lyase family enzyme
MILHHVAVVCRSEELADRFYRGILGLRRMKTSELHSELGERIFGIARECRFALYGNEMSSVEVFVHGEAHEKTASYAHICLEVEDREGLLSKCRSEDLTVKEIPKGDAVLTFIADFDGNLFEIKQMKQ